MSRAGPFPRWLWDPTTHGWLLLRADGTLSEEGGPGDPPMPTEPPQWRWMGRPATPAYPPAACPCGRCGSAPGSDTSWRLAGIGELQFWEHACPQLPPQVGHLPHLPVQP